MGTRAGWNSEHEVNLQEQREAFNAVLGGILNDTIEILSFLQSSIEYIVFRNTLHSHLKAQYVARAHLHTLN